ncbi:MAG: AAA family ATPase [Thermoplasmata archaeon]|nr:AAA family ATPase [Thermoplasmata archaeon]
MTEPVVTLTGPPGSGKTTAGRLTAERLKLKFVSAGELFRAEAALRGMDLPTFSQYAERHEEVDRALDEKMLAQAKPDHLLEGRITGALCRRRGIGTIYLVVTAPEEVRVARIAGRDGGTMDAVRAATRQRERSEAERYSRYYHIDLTREPADLTVDSTSLIAGQVADRLSLFVRRRREAPP